MHMKRPPTLEQEASPKPAPKLKPDWAAIKHDALAGMKVEPLARKYGIPEKTLRNRIEREDWPTPHRLEKAAQRIESMRLAGGETFTLSDIEAVLLAEGDLSPEGVDSYRNLVFRLCKQGIAQFGVAAPIPKTWKELEIADKMARRAAGLDDKTASPSTLVQVNVLRTDSDPVIDVSGSVGK